MVNNHHTSIFLTYQTTNTRNHKPGELMLPFTLRVVDNRTTLTPHPCNITVTIESLTNVMLHSICFVNESEIGTGIKLEANMRRVQAWFQKQCCKRSSDKTGSCMCVCVVSNIPHPAYTRLSPANCRRYAAGKLTYFHGTMVATNSNAGS